MHSLVSFIYFKHFIDKLHERTKTARGHKIARRYFCTKTLFHEDTFAQGDKIARRHFLHEGSL